MGRKEIKQKAKSMAEKIEERIKDKVLTYYEADRIVLEIIKSHFTDKLEWHYTKGIFEVNAEFDCINMKYKVIHFAYEIDDMIYLNVCYKMIEIPENIKEDDKDEIKNIKVTLESINKPSKQDFDDRDICYKDDKELEKQYEEE